MANDKNKGKILLLLLLLLLFLLLLPRDKSLPNRTEIAASLPTQFQDATCARQNLH